MRRQPELKMKNVKNLSLHRAKCTSTLAIQAWFRQYKEWLRILNITDGDQLWNVDESGLCDQPKDDREVVGHRDEPQFQVVWGEKGENHTVLGFVSAGGLIAPPNMLVKGQRIQTQLRAVCPAGMRVSCSPKGYISAACFYEYSNFFVSWLRARGGLGGHQKHLILLDGHSSHLYNIDFMKLMRANNISVASLPPHTTHILQPLDDVPFANLKKVWNSNLLDKNEVVTGRKLTKEEVMHMFMETWNEAVTPETVKAGFRNTGMWPADPTTAKLKHTTTEFINRPPRPAACKLARSGSIWLPFVFLSNCYLQLNCGQIPTEFFETFLPHIPQLQVTF
jgi:4-hydroxybenzoate polyprenyltransferase